MAWALDAAATPQVAISGTIVTIPLTIGGGANRAVIVGGGIPAGVNVTGATFNGVSVTAVPNPASGTHEARLFLMLEASLPGAGTYDVVITVSGALNSSTPLIGHAACFTGLAQVAAESSFWESYGSVSSISDNVTPTTDGALIVALLNVLDPRTITPTGGQGAAISTLDGTSSHQRSRLYAWTGPTPAALLSSSFTLSSASATNAQHVAAFGIAAGAPPAADPFITVVFRAA
jgi:hypothetical protein